MSEDKPEIDSDGAPLAPLVVPSFVSIEEVGSVELESAEEVLLPEESATVTTATRVLSPPRSRRVRLTSITEVIEEEDDFDSFASPCQSITLKCDIKIIVTSYDDEDDGNDNDRTFVVTLDSPPESAVPAAADQDEFESVAESPTDFLFDDDECERLSSNFAETDTEDDKPAISDEDLELVDISSDEDGGEFENLLRLERLGREKKGEDDDLGGGPSFAVDIFRDWIKGPVAVEAVEAVEDVIAPLLQPDEASAVDSAPDPPAAEAEAVEDDEYEALRLRRLRGDDRRGGRGREAAPERDVAEDDTETAEFQSRLRKLSNPSAAPGSEVQNPPSLGNSPDEVADPIEVKSQEPERAPADPGPGITQQGSAAPSEETPAEDPNAGAAKRLKSRDLFEIKRRNKQQGAKPPPPPPAGRRGSWHLESVDELAPLFAGPIEKLPEEEGEQEEGEEEEDRESKTSSKEASPGGDSGGKSGSPPPRLFR